MACGIARKNKEKNFLPLIQLTLCLLQEVSDHINTVTLQLFSFSIGNRDSIRFKIGIISDQDEKSKVCIEYNREEGFVVWYQRTDLHCSMTTVPYLQTAWMMASKWWHCTTY